MMNKPVLQESLLKALLVGVPTYILIDPLVGEPIPTNIPSSNIADATMLTGIREQTWHRKVYLIDLGDKIDLPKPLHPYCVALQGRDDLWLASSLVIAQSERDQSEAAALAGKGSSPHRVSGWLQTTIRGEQLAEQLGAMMQVNTDAITKASYQRLADRRVFDYLRHIVGDTRMSAMLGQIQQWSYLNAQGDLSSVCGISEKPQPIRLSRSEWAEFMLGEALHLIITRWLVEMENNKTATNQTKSLYEQAKAALQQTNKANQRWPQRFKDDYDITAWAVLQLMYPDIDKVPGIVAALDAPPKQDEPIETLNTLYHTLTDMLKG